MLSSRPLMIPTNFDEGPIQVANTKTPAKTLHKTPGRTIARNRIALQENAAYYGEAMTVNRKGKAMMQTPLRLGVSPRKGMQTTIKPTIQVSRPLGDKTPFPNRQQNIAPLHTPAPKAAKVAKLSLLEQDLQELAKTPGHLLLPSSTRKSLRAPRHSGEVKCFDFKTPMTNGNHWDVSDGEIQLDVNTAEAEAEDEEDYDEIEYMPPKVQELPYEPLFPMPDYKALGRNLLSLASSAYIDDTAELHFARLVEDEIDCEQILESTNSLKWTQAYHVELVDEDPFQPIVTELTVHKSTARPLTRSQSTTASKVSTTRSTQIGTTRSSATATRPPSTTTNRSPSSNSAGSSRVPSQSAHTNLKSTSGPTTTRSTIPLPNPPVTRGKQPVATRTTGTRAPVVTKPISGVTVTRSRSITIPKPAGKIVPSSTAATAPLFALEDEAIVEVDFIFDL